MTAYQIIATAILYQPYFMCGLTCALNSRLLGPRAVLVVRILIVDDHHQFRAQLRALLESMEEWEVCAEAQNGVEAVEKHCYIQPHVTVMDFNMPDLNGLLASREILRKCPDATILLLTVFASPQLAIRAKREGIKGFCSKTAVDCIPLAIQSLLRGETYFPESFAAPAGD